MTLTTTIASNSTMLLTPWVTQLFTSPSAFHDHIAEAWSSLTDEESTKTKRGALPFPRSFKQLHEQTIKIVRAATQHPLVVATDAGAMPSDAGRIPRAAALMAAPDPTDGQTVLALVAVDLHNAHVETLLTETGIVIDETLSLGWMERTKQGPSAFLETLQTALGQIAAAADITTALGGRSWIAINEGLIEVALVEPPKPRLIRGILAAGKVKEEEMPDLHPEAPVCRLVLKRLISADQAPWVEPLRQMLIELATLHEGPLDVLTAVRLLRLRTRDPDSDLRLKLTLEPFIQDAIKASQSPF